MASLIFSLGLGLAVTGTAWGAENSAALPARSQVETALAAEVAPLGWLVFCARSENGSWDLFASRPDGSARRNLTNTPEFEEAGPLFSHDGKRLLYRRIERGAVIGHDRWGFQGQLVIAKADATEPDAIGPAGEFSWASWSPDDRQIACLSRKEIEIYEWSTRRLARTLPRQGIYQQLFWSPDGESFCGVANFSGQVWTIVRLKLADGSINAVHSYQNCTPDWFPDSRRILFSSRPANQVENKGYGWTQLWQADVEGHNAGLIFGEDGYHIYGGALSPDGKYVLFTKSVKDGGDSERNGAPLFLMRMADAPTIGGESAELRKLHLKTKAGPILALADGWEPCWTFAPLPFSR